MNRLFFFGFEKSVDNILHMDLQMPARLMYGWPTFYLETFTNSLMNGSG